MMLTNQIPASEIREGDYLAGIDNGYVMEDPGPACDGMSWRSGGYDTAPADALLLIQFYDAQGNECALVLSPDTPVSVARESWADYQSPEEKQALADYEATQKAVELRDRWRTSLARKEELDTFAADRDEQEAYDALVDHVEASGLNYTEFDPRGPQSPTDEPEVSV